MNSTVRHGGEGEGVQGVAILGSTGSIGASTLQVLELHPERFRVTALTAHRNVQVLYRQCKRWKPRHAVLADPDRAEELARQLRLELPEVEVLGGVEALRQVAAAPESDCVIAAIVGAAGLEPTLAAAHAGKRLLLANKEALVMAGELFMRAVVEGGGELLPVDSEHNALFQCLPGKSAHAGTWGVRRLLLTASGGPFRDWSAARLAEVTPEQACRHPNWSMGPKISVDSATMMNKGLEVIEACHLFAVAPERVQVVVHPQSIVHSLVEYLDGSMLAQLSRPDMRTPIAHALAWPRRMDAGVDFLELARAGPLEFEDPDEERFPCLRLARAALERGATAPAVLNAANEEAVAAFLDGRLRFPDIFRVIEAVLEVQPIAPADTLEQVREADRQARASAARHIQERMECKN